jgi:hypothetical protein
VCVNTTWGHLDCHSQPPSDCCNYLFTLCVPADQCAPEGVLKHQPYDAGNVLNEHVCEYPDNDAQ